MLVDVETAYEAMNAGAPVSKCAIASTHSEWKPEVPIFRQWTGMEEPNVRLSCRPPGDVVEIPDGHRWGYVAQWMYFMGDVGLYVNLPGMQQGRVPDSGKFEVGTERVYSDTPAEELDRLIADGLGKLMELVAAEKSKAT